MGIAHGMGHRSKCQNEVNMWKNILNSISPIWVQDPNDLLWEPKVIREV